MDCDYSQLSSEDLLARCADCGNSRAWEEFLRRFHPFVVSVALRTIRRYTPICTDLCEDLTQEVYLKLSAHNGRLLRAFVPRHPGSAYGFVRLVTANLIHDYFRGRGRVRQDGPLPDNLEAAPNIHGRLLERDIDDLLRRHGKRSERQIFWLHYGEGLVAQEIAALPEFGLSTKGVESLLRRMRLLLRRHLGIEPA